MSVDGKSIKLYFHLLSIAALENKNSLLEKDRVNKIYLRTQWGISMWIKNTIHELKNVIIGSFIEIYITTIKISKGR